MSDLPLKPQVFAQFKQISSDHKISKSEFQELQARICSDGVLDAGERQLLESLRDGMDWSLGLQAEGSAETLAFRPGELDTTAVRGEIAAALSPSAAFKKQWNQAVRDGRLGANELKALQRQARTPADLLFLQQLSSDRAELSNFDGVNESWRLVGGEWQLDLGQLRQQLEALAGWRGGDDSIKQLLICLNHPNPKVRDLATATLESKLRADGSGLSSLDGSIIQRMKELGLPKSNPAGFQHFTAIVRQQARQEYAGWQQGLDAELTSINAIADPGSRLAAWQRLGQEIRMYQRNGGASPGDASERKLASAMDKALTSLQGTLSPRQQLEWLQTQQIFHPQAAQAGLQAMVFNPALDGPDGSDSSIRQQAMSFLLTNLPAPAAQQLFLEVMAGRGEPSQEMKSEAAFHLPQVQKTGVREYTGMLSSREPEARLRGIRGLGQIQHADAVKALMLYFRTRADADEGPALAEALEQLQRSAVPGVAARARDARQQLSSASGHAKGAAEVQALVRQGDQAAVAKLVTSFADAPMRQSALKGLVSLLETADAAGRDRILGWLEQGGGSLAGPAATSLDQLLAAYRPDPSALPAQLQRLAWLEEPLQQARLLRQAAADHPEPAARRQLERQLDKAIENQHGNLGIEEKVAFASARYRLNPDKGAGQLEKLLQAGAGLDDDGRKSVLETLFSDAIADQGLDQGLRADFVRRLARQYLSSENAALAQTAAAGLKQRGWNSLDDDRQLLQSGFAALRAQGIDQIQARALRGEAGSLEALAGHHLHAHRLQDKQAVIAALEAVATSASPLAAVARTQLHALDQAAANQPLLPADTADGRDARGKIKVLLSELRDIEIFDWDRLKRQREKYLDIKYPDRPKGLPVLPMASPAQADWDKDEMQSTLAETALADAGWRKDFLARGLPYEKGDMLRWLMRHKTDANRERVLQILNSSPSLAEHDAMLNELRDDRDSNFNLKSYLGQELYQRYDSHYQSLIGFDKDFHATTRVLMQDPNLALKGDFLGKALLDYRTGKLTRPEALHAVNQILRSLETPDDYDRTLKQMQTLHQVSELQLEQLLGARPLQEIQAEIGLQPARSDYSDEDLAAAEIQDFMRLIARPEYRGDGDRVHEHLETLYPELRRHPAYQKYFADPDLGDRLLVARLIVQNKIPVHSVSDAFMNRALFGQSSKGIFAGGGTDNLANFLAGSVREKARQFLALDDFAGRVHQRTRSFLDGRAAELRTLAANPAGIEASLKLMQTELEPYRSSLYLGLAGNPDGLLKAQILQRHPDSGEAFVAQEIKKLRLYQQLLDDYGTDGTKAAAIMRSQADEVVAMKATLGVDRDYASQRSRFMRQTAFELYYAKDMDLLQHEYQDIVASMSRKGSSISQVLDRASAMKDDFKRAGTIARMAVGLLTGTAPLLEAANLTVRLGTQLGPNRRLVAGGVRSQEAQDQAFDRLIKEIVWEAATRGVVKGLQVYQREASLGIEQQANELFGAAPLHDDMIEARKVFIRNASDGMQRQLKSVRAAYVGFRTAIRDSDYTKAFSSAFVDILFQKALSTTALTDRQYSTLIAERLISPAAGALDKGLETLDGPETPEEARPPREPLALLQPLEKTIAESFLVFVLAKYPELRVQVPTEINNLSDL
ncbi:MAG: hypothetical protein ACAI44_07565, partial [Candidatus Sericytochromatia bacterium]